MKDETRFGAVAVVQAPSQRSDRSTALACSILLFIAYYHGGGRGRL